jgi:antimicrobial peptide system SdpB family protein
MSLLFNKDPYNQNYQFARALIAFAQLINMIFTPYEYYFKNPYQIVNLQNILPNYFLILENNISFIISLILLIWVISGYLPQLSCFFHAYFSFCFFFGSTIVEGGDQISQIITILLIPICVFDKRLFLWKNNKKFNYKSSDFIKLFCNSTFIVIQIQIAVIYLFSGAVKINVDEWKDGSAMYYWFNNINFGANTFNKFLFKSIMDNHFISPFINWSILALEFILFACLFMTDSDRKKMYFPSVIFHLMIGLILGLWSFSLTMIALLTIYLSPNFVNNKKYNNYD